MFKKKSKDQKTIDRSNIYTTGQLGRTRETTPEGYLLCRDVPIARIGTLMYGKGEVPVTADDTGLILIQRGEDVLFDPKTIASAESKPITDDHPDDWVNPENWKELSKGTGQNVRRGDGIDSDYLLADLLITDKDTIQAVIDGKVEISLGYDADYTEVSKGKGLQSNIVINHIALVDKGRCGSRCSIGDSFMSSKTKQKEPWYQSLLGLKRTVDQAVEEAKKTSDTDEEDPETEDEEPEEEKTKTGDAKFQADMRKFMKTMDSRLTALEKKKTKDSEDPEKIETDDEEPEDEKTKDDILKAEEAKKLSEEGVQNHTGDSLAEIRARAEILAPGIAIPTLDSAAKDIGKKVLSIKRQALKQAYSTKDGQAAISPFIGANTNFDSMTAATLDTAFIGASELVKQKNNSLGVRSGISTKDFGRAPSTVADINARNREFWANRNK